MLIHHLSFFVFSLLQSFKLLSLNKWPNQEQGEVLKLVCDSNPVKLSTDGEEKTGVNFYFSKSGYQALNTSSCQGVQAGDAEPPSAHRDFSSQIFLMDEFREFFPEKSSRTQQLMQWTEVTDEHLLPAIYFTLPQQQEKQQQVHFEILPPQILILDVIDYVE